MTGRSLYFLMFGENNMIIEKIKRDNITVAVVSGEGKLICDVDSALDVMMSVKYEAECDNIIINKKLITEDFFVLSKGLAGEILQKFKNYNVRLAVYGDFSKYTSKPLKDFIYESNKGKDFFFVQTQDEAIEKMVQK